jgi:DNA-directed RNA polymerase subunit RPC12/RpoP
MGRARLINAMKPIAARVLITLIVLAFVIGASVFVNSRFHGSFAAGIIVIVLPFLALSFSLPYLLPVRCPKCSGKMRFNFLKQKTDSRQMYAYICERCIQRHEWEGASSGSALDN